MQEQNISSLSVSVSLLEITLRSSLSPSISFDYPHAKIQIPQDTNSLSRHNYKMLYASVNSTSVTVTVCICHEMRQKQDEFALVKRDEGGSLFCALLADCAMGVCSSLHHKWALMFHTGFAPEESIFVWEHLVLTDCLFCPPSSPGIKQGTSHYLSSILYFVCLLDQMSHSFIYLF